MHFFIKKFKFKFIDLAIKQQCTFILQNFTNCSQCEIIKVKIKTANSFCHKHKFKKLKKSKNSQFDAI